MAAMDRTMHRMRKVFLMLFALVAASMALPAGAQTVEYIHTDALGSVVAVSNAAGTVVERREYEPYGTQLTPALKDGPGYTGHVQDAATGLVYAQQRYYDPILGRFVSVDPVGVSPINGLNFNRYWYASNSPYKNTDPDGRCDGPSTCAIDRDIAAMNRGEMSRDEFMDRSNARAAGAAGGLLIVATRGSVLRYLPAVSRILSRNTQQTSRAEGKPDQTVYRFGTSKESPTRLGNKAAEAEGKIGVHGVSASTTRPSSPCSSASCSSLEAGGLSVRATPTKNDPGHVTVELPKPVTKETADAFNKAFGR